MLEKNSSGTYNPDTWKYCSYWFFRYGFSGFFFIFKFKDSALFKYFQSISSFFGDSSSHYFHMVITTFISREEKIDMSMGLEFQTMRTWWVLPKDADQKGILVVQGSAMLKLGRMYRQTEETFGKNESGLRLLEFATFTNLALINTLGPTLTGHPEMDMTQPRWETSQSDWLHLGEEALRSWPGDDDLSSLFKEGEKTKPARTNVWSWEAKRTQMWIPTSNNRWEICTTHRPEGCGHAINAIITTYTTAATNAASKILW